MGREAAVECNHALLLPDELETLHQASVFDMAVLGGCEPKASADNLMNVLVFK